MRGSTFLPQTAASSAERVFGAKIPLPAFFMACVLRASLPLAEHFAEQRTSAFFAPEAFCALLLWAPFTSSAKNVRRAVRRAPCFPKSLSGTRLPLESFVIFLAFVTVLRIAFFTTCVVLTERL